MAYKRILMYYLTFIMSSSSYHLFPHKQGAAFIGCGRIRKTPMKERTLRYNFFTLVYVMEGRGYFTDSKGRKYPLGPGSYFIREIGVPHSLCVESARWEERFILFKSFRFLHDEDEQVLHDGNFDWLMPGREIPFIRDETRRILDALCIREKGAPPCGQCRPDASLLQEWDEILNAMKTGERPERLQSRILALMERLLRPDPKAYAPPEEIAALRIRRTATDRLPLRQLLEDLPLSYSRLRVLFVRRWGVGPGEYRIRCRMEQAWFLLQDPGIRIREIADRLGYKDSFAFSRQFKQHFGCSPLHYRKGCSGNGNEG